MTQYETVMQYTPAQMGEWIYNIVLHLPETREEKHRRFVQWYKYTDKEANDIISSCLRKRYSMELLMYLEECILRYIVKDEHVEDMVKWMKSKYGGIKKKDNGTDQTKTMSFLWWESRTLWDADK